MSLRAYIAGLVLAVAVPAAHAAPIAYAEAVAPSAYTGSGGQSSLYSIDLATRTATLIGPSVANPNGLVNGLFPFNIRGLSFDPSRQLYAVSEDLKVLVKLNVANGAATLVGPLNLSGPGVATAQNGLGLSMAITCDGKAWLASGTTNNLWSVNLATGATTLVGSLGNNPITGLAAQGVAVYGTGSQTNQRLYTINTATGATSLVGSYGNVAGAVHTISPAFDAGGQLWAVLNDRDENVSSSEQWSNLGQISALGSLNSLGTITGSTLPPSGLVGLAITPPVCSVSVDPPTTAAAPSLSRGALLGLILLMIGCASLPLAQRARSRR